jgi:hypothetical protein
LFVDPFEVMKLSSPHPGYSAMDKACCPWTTDVGC